MKGWLAVDEVAQYASVSKRTVWKWINEGLESVKIGRTVRIKIEWVDEFLESHKVDRMARIKQDVGKLIRNIA